MITLLISNRYRKENFIDGWSSDLHWVSVVVTGCVAQVIVCGALRRKGGAELKKKSYLPN